MLRCSIANHSGQTAGFEGFFHGPIEGDGLFQGDREETLPGKTESFQTVTIEIAVFADFSFDATP